MCRECLKWLLVCLEAGRADSSSVSRVVVGVWRQEGQIAALCRECLKWLLVCLEAGRADSSSVQRVPQGAGVPAQP